MHSRDDAGDLLTISALETQTIGARTYLLREAVIDKLGTGYLGEKDGTELLYFLAGRINSLIEIHYLWLPHLQLLIFRVLLLGLTLLLQYEFLEECPWRPTLKDGLLHRLLSPRQGGLRLIVLTGT